MEIGNGTILYRAHRLRFIIAALFLFPITVGMIALGYDGLVVGDPDVRGTWAAIPLCALFLWFDYIIAVKLIKPPEMEISLQGIRWENDALLQRNTQYGWSDIEGPQRSSGGYGVPLLQIVVKATGRKLSLPPSHFGATYDEMAAVISAARDGTLISPVRWRADHPQHVFRRWLLSWGLPIALAIVVAIALGWFRD